MKNVLSIITMLTLTLSVGAQTEGRIAFSRIMQLKIDAPDGMEEMFKNMPKERTAKKELTFTKQSSIYQNPKDDIGTDDNIVNLSQGDMSISFDFTEPEASLYMDLAKGEKIDQKEFFGKLFLVQSKTGSHKWKLGSRKLKIGDYICMEATTTVSDTVPVIAWYTPQIRVSAGPAGYEGLPGMILKIEEGEKLVHIATSVHLEDIDPKGIIAPRKGKKVTPEEFKAIQKEKLDDMGLGGGVKIMVNKQ